MKFYKVTSRYYDDGHCDVKLTTVYAAEKPQDTSKELKHCDLYYDYFEDQQEATIFADTIKAQNGATE